MVNRVTIKEIKRWMKTLEENRYRKIVNADARRIAWFVNNSLSEDYDTMPESMRKKWVKAEYKKERYLAKEFMKSQKAKLKEEKFYAFYNRKKYTIDGKSLWDAKQKAILKLKVPKSKVGLLSIVNAGEHERGGFRFEQKLREMIKETIRGILSEKTTTFQMDTPDMKKVDMLLKKGKFKGLNMKAKGPKFTLTVPKKMEDEVLSYLIQKGIKGINEV